MQGIRKLLDGYIGLLLEQPPLYSSFTILLANPSQVDVCEKCQSADYSRITSAFLMPYRYVALNYATVNVTEMDDTTDGLLRALCMK